MRHFLAIVILMLGVQSVRAQDWVIGLGYADFTNPQSIDDPLLSFEYHATPFYQTSRFSAGFGVVAEVHKTGDFFVGAGLAGLYELNRRWFVEASVMPGYFHKSMPQNNLGSKFEIRSLLGLGLTLESGNRISLALTHKSNASTAQVNPGVNSLLLRFRKKF